MKFILAAIFILSMTVVGATAQASKLVPKLKCQSVAEKVAVSIGETKGTPVIWRSYPSVSDVEGQFDFHFYLVSEGSLEKKSYVVISYEPSDEAECDIVRVSIETP